MGVRICERLGSTKFHLTVTFTPTITLRSLNCDLISSVDLYAHFGTPHGSFMSNLKNSHFLPQISPKTPFSRIQCLCDHQNVFIWLHLIITLLLIPNKSSLLLTQKILTFSKFWKGRGHFGNVPRVTESRHHSEIVANHLPELFQVDLGLDLKMHTSTGGGHLE